MDRSAELQAICMARGWVELLADRWIVSTTTVRAWAVMGHFGVIYRRDMGTLSVGSQAVFEFEVKHADVLGLGAPVIDAVQLQKRYGISRRTLTRWQSVYKLPRAARIIGSNIRRWRVRDIEQWEFAWKITPKTTIVS